MKTLLSILVMLDLIFCDTVSLSRVSNIPEKAVSTYSFCPGWFPLCHVKN